MIGLEKRVYLASRSLRRRELLKQIGVNFEVLLLRGDPNRAADVDETPLPDEPPAEYVSRMARLKAQAGWLRVLERRLPDYPVVAADTTVVVDGATLGKPANRDEAVAMLQRLSGNQHEVLTAVAICRKEHLKMRLCTSMVEFRALDEAEIRRYVATGEPLDKAGAYAIQGRAGTFVSRLCGSYSGVMGLPLYETGELLASFGYPPL